MLKIVSEESEAASVERYAKVLEEMAAEIRTGAMVPTCVMIHVFFPRSMVRNQVFIGDNFNALEGVGMLELTKESIKGYILRQAHDRTQP